MLKENKEVMDALGALARRVGVSMKQFTFAGTKDKRGVTVQRVTGHKVAMETMQAVGTSVFGVRVGNFRYSLIQINSKRQFTYSKVCVFFFWKKQKDMSRTA
jgi:tRNA(Glu) U13 pseudouridine synthase TruD